MKLQPSGGPGAIRTMQGETWEACQRASLPGSVNENGDENG